MKKLVLWAGGLLLIGSSLLLPMAASAVVDPGSGGGTTYNWADRATIVSSDGTSYIDGDVKIGDDTNIFNIVGTDPNQPTGCNVQNGTYKKYNGASLIDFKNGLKDGNGQGTLVTFSNPSVGSQPGSTACVETDTPISVGNAAYESASYDWIDGSTIRGIPDEDNNNDGDVYTLQGGFYVDTNSGTCHDYFTANANDPTAKATFQEVVSTINARAGADYTKKNGCYYLNTTSTWLLGDPNNAAAAAGTGGGAGGASGPAANAPPTCDVGSFSWLVCPAITLVHDGIQTIFKDLVVPLLATPAFTSNNALHPLWQSLVYLADIFFVVIFMVVIFGASLGLQNYSVKTILPRLIASAILIQFSYIIAGIIIDLGNVLGVGVMQLISTVPLPQGAAHISDGGTAANIIGGTAEVLLTGGALYLFGFGIIGFIALAIVIGVATLMISLIFREIAISLMVVLSPLAFAAWVLPGTEKYFRTWLKDLIKLSLMYPLIMLIMGVSSIMASVGFNTTDQSTISGATASNATAAASLIPKLITSIIPILAFFLIPMTFKAAGSMMGVVDSQISKRGRNMASGHVANAKKSAADNKQTRVTKLGAKGAASSNPLMSGVGRVARVSGGFGIGGAKSDARLHAAHAKLENEEMAGFARKFQGMDADEILKRVQGSRSASERKAGIAALAKNGSTTQLAALLDKQYGGDHTNEEWKAGIGASFSDIKARAPHLVAGQTSFANISAASLATLDATGRAAYHQHLQTAALNPTDPANAATLANAQQVIGQLESSPRLVSSLAGDARAPIAGSKGTPITISQIATAAGTSFTIPAPTPTAPQQPNPATLNVPPQQTAPQHPPVPQGPIPTQPIPYTSGPTPAAPSSVPPLSDQNPRLTERLVDPRVEGDAEVGSDDRII